MSNRNDITNDLIKSRLYSEEARKSHENIFAKRTFGEWCAIEGGPMLIPKNPKEKISYSEFKNMLKFKSSDTD